LAPTKYVRLQLQAMARVSPVNLISKLMREAAPSLWQRLKYLQYLSARSSEREIHIVHKYIDPKRAAVDIGVHLGFYSRHFAKYASSVIGFEANPDSATFAKRSLAGLATIEWVALSSEAGTGQLRIPVGTSGGEAALGTLSHTNQLDGRRFLEVSVPVRTLDEFDLPPVGFAKIDVEGHEEAVLQGGQKLLARDHPVYMIEIEDRYNPGALPRILHYFNNVGYDGMFYDGILMKSIEEFDQKKYQTEPGKDFINNFFFFPRKM
jgi:FkbM family methyltransferase